MDQHNPTLPAPIQTQICSSPAGRSADGYHQYVSATGTDETLTESRSSGWFGDLFGRIRSVFRSWDINGNKGIHKSLFTAIDGLQFGKLISGDEWEKQFEELSFLERLASGGQGDVYKARMRNEIVAVKIVNDKKEAEIPVLRQLNHPNIVRFK